jgi:hypothetical protein
MSLITERKTANSQWLSLLFECIRQMRCQRLALRHQRWLAPVSPSPLPRGPCGSFFGLLSTVACIRGSRIYVTTRLPLSQQAATGLLLLDLTELLNVLA